MDVSEPYYRVVGVRPDGSRRILADELSPRVAYEICEQLGEDVFANIFARLIVEKYEPGVVRETISDLLFPASRSTGH